MKTDWLRQGAFLVISCGNGRLFFGHDFSLTLAENNSH